MKIKLDKQFADNCTKVLDERKAKRMSGIESVTISTPGHEPAVIDSEAAKRIREACDSILGGGEGDILAKCMEASRDLLAHHWDKISDIRDGNEKASVAIAVTFNVDCSGPTPKIITKLSYAQKFKDEREDVLADDAQPGLGLSEKP